MIKMTRLEDFCLLAIVAAELKSSELNAALNLAIKAETPQVILDFSQVENCSSLDELKQFLYERQQFLSFFGGSLKVINTNPSNGIDLSILRQAGLQAYQTIDIIDINENE